MHLFIIGAPASGKMTIGQELSRLTDSTLFYNHQAIDFALEIYQDYTEEMWEFVRGITFSFLGASARNQRSVILTDVIEREILETTETLQLNSQHQPNELHHYLKINNTNLSAEEVAKQIQNKMNKIEKGQTHV